MKTIRTKVYQFSELSESAKETAITEWRNRETDNQHYYDEIIDSVKAVIDLFNLKTGRTYTDLRHSHLDDNILELKGVRLYKYIMNNYGDDLFTPTYIKCIDRVVKWKPFICKVNTGKDGQYTMIYSRNKVDNCCPLTGVCYDNDILDPVYNFLKRPDQSTTYEDLISEIESAISKTFDNTEEWLNSDEFIKDEIEANGDYDFTKEGKLFHS